MAGERLPAQRGRLSGAGDAAGEVRCLDAADAILDTLSDPGDLPRRSRDLRQRASSVMRTWTEFGEELSDREIAVLQLAGEGLTQREIADQLFISYNTVKSHLRSTYRKLGATSRTTPWSAWQTSGPTRHPVAARSRHPRRRHRRLTKPGRPRR